ncbi:S8 family serine peptidase [Rhodococcus hoagii]|nr:S8 family serine peptidase [Prescottella equi]
MRAANSNVDVINLSITACYPVDQFVDTSDVAAALRYAVETKDVVVITAAGNSDSEACSSNPDTTRAMAATRGTGTVSPTCRCRRSTVRWP